MQLLLERPRLSADGVYMRTKRPEFTVLEYRQRWHVVGERVYREAVVRRADGELRIFLMPEGRLGE